MGRTIRRIYTSDSIIVTTTRSTSFHHQSASSSTTTCFTFFGFIIFTSFKTLSCFIKIICLWRSVYKSKLTNHKLDRAFSSSSSFHQDRDETDIRSYSSSSSSDMILSFYAPQLLCFLLHNAYLNTDKLERWILRKC
jgi:hypothetical protein